MKLVASIITITTRQDFYLWLDKLSWTFTSEDKKSLADKAKFCKRALWSYQTGFKFW